MCIIISARDDMRLPQRAAQRSLSHFLLAKDVLRLSDGLVALLKYMSKGETTSTVVLEIG